MNRLVPCLVTVLMFAVAFPHVAEALYSIPTDEVDKCAIYWGDSSGFTKPAYVDYNVLIESTAEYKQIKQDKLSSTEPRCWILMADAADKVAGAINRIAKGKGYDLVCAKDYWNDLQLEVKAEDITDLVKEKITEKK